MENHIILDGFKYRGSMRRYTRTQNYARVVRATIGKVHVIQDFLYQETRWTADIIVPLTLQLMNWGSLETLQDAYEKEFFSCTDQEGNVYDVTMEGELQLPFEFTIVDESHPFTTSISLRRILT